MVVAELVVHPVLQYGGTGMSGPGFAFGERRVQLGGVDTGGEEGVDAGGGALPGDVFDDRPEPLLVSGVQPGRPSTHQVLGFALLVPPHRPVPVGSPSDRPRGPAAVAGIAWAGRPAGPPGPEAVFTTESMLTAEDDLLAWYRDARVDHGAVPLAAVPDTVIAAAVASVSAAIAEECGDAGGGLSDEQAALVAAVAGSGDGVRCAVGPAGTGKTEAMRAAVTAWQQVGCTVLGCANGGAQAEQLGARLGVRSEVVRSWLTRLETADDPTDIWVLDTVVVIDEATQVSTRDAERLARRAARTSTVLVFVGDPAQLGSVGAGGWFRHIVYSDGAPTLSKIYRQQGDEMGEVREALGGLRSQMPQRVRAAMARLVADGRVRVFDDADTMLAQVVDDWYTDRQTRLTANGNAPKPSRMMAAHHREVDLLNAAARRHLALDGTLTGPELTVAGRRFQVGDEVVTLTQAGHDLIPDGAPRDRYIRTGTVGHVTEVHLDANHPDAQWMRVSFPGRGQVTVGWEYLNRSFDDGRTGGLAHSYAITADRSQGSTMHTARPVHTDSTSRQAFYVMASRGERDLCAYVIRDRDLEHRDDEQWLPVLATPGGALAAVVDNLERSRTERLAGDLDPVAWAAQHLRRGRTLADLAAIARTALSDPQARKGGVPLIVARQAELAEQSAVTAAAITSAPPEVMARHGGRPGGGQHRRAWDAAVSAVGAYRARNLSVTPHNTTAGSAKNPSANERIAAADSRSPDQAATA